MRAYRNYLVAFALCLSTTVLSLMGRDNWDSWYWFLQSDINVALYLFIAWLFDSRRG